MASSKAKKKKSRQKTPVKKLSGKEVKMYEAEKKIERLELLSQAQDLEHLTTKVQALQGKLQQLQTEANITNRTLTDLRKEGKQGFEVYNVELAMFKKKYDVPSDKEVNLRTGELVDPQPPQGGAPVPQEGPSPGTLPEGAEPKEAPQS